MGHLRRVSPATACCVRASPIPSTPGLTVSVMLALPAYTCGPDAGASPLFPPWRTTAATARDELLHLIARTPRACGIERTRWTLTALRGACVWLVSRSLAGVHGILRRLGIHWKRGRQAVRSPDPNYHP